MNIVDMLLTRGANMRAKTDVRYFVLINFFELKLILLLLLLFNFKVFKVVYSLFIYI